MNKKGMFALLLALLVILVLTMAYIRIMKSYGAIEHVGESTLRLRDAVHQGERLAISMEAAGQQAVLDSLVDLGLHGPSVCGRYFGVPVWYKDTECVPDKALLKDSFDALLNIRLRTQRITLGLPSTEYDTVIEELPNSLRIGAIPLAADIILLACMNAAQDCGTYGTKLSFTTEIPYTFADYAAIETALTQEKLQALQHCTDCTAQIDALDTDTLDFSADCVNDPESAYYAFLESMARCAQASTNCNCGDVPGNLGPEFQIKLQSHDIMLVYVPTQEVLLQDKFQHTLCFGNDVVFEAEVEQDKVRVNQKTTMPPYPLVKNDNKLCFVSAPTQLPACAATPKKTLKLCATSQRYSVAAFNPLTKKFSQQPVQYQFAVAFE